MLTQLATTGDSSCSLACHSFLSQMAVRAQAVPRWSRASRLETACSMRLEDAIRSIRSYDVAITVSMNGISQRKCQWPNRFFRPTSKPKTHTIKIASSLFRSLAPYLKNWTRLLTRFSGYRHSRWHGPYLLEFPLEGILRRGPRPVLNQGADYIGNIRVGFWDRCQ